MSRQTSDGDALALAALMGGTALLGGVALAVALWPKAQPARRAALPSDDWQTAPTFTEADVEAAARMLASENPRGSRALHVEQIHTQLRSCKAGQGLFERITAGSGWGPQGERRRVGGIRPVSTEQEATQPLRQLAREALAGLHSSQFAGARKYFEPVQQDRAYAIGTQARAKQAAGVALTDQEKRLLHYRRTAQQVRASWRSEGAQLVGTLDGVEFYS